MPIFPLCPEAHRERGRSGLVWKIGDRAEWGGGAMVGWIKERNMQKAVRKKNDTCEWGAFLEEAHRIAASQGSARTG